MRWCSRLTDERVWASVARTPAAFRTVRRRALRPVAFLFEQGEFARVFQASFSTFARREIVRDLLFYATDSPCCMGEFRRCFEQHGVTVSVRLMGGVHAPGRLTL